MIEQDDVESIRRLQSEPPGAVLELLGTASDDVSVLACKSLDGALCA